MISKNKILLIFVLSLILIFIASIKVKAEPLCTAATFCDEDGLPSLPSGGRYEKICSNCCGTDKRWDQFNLICTGSSPISTPIPVSSPPTSGLCGNTYCDENGLSPAPSGSNYQKTCSNCCGDKNRFDSFLLVCPETPNIIPNISAFLTANPDSGTVPLNVVLSSSADGNSTGTVNYSFWWNCPSTTTDVSTASSVCGSLLSPPSGNCTGNSNGYKCDGVSLTTQLVSTIYTTSGTKTPKVIIERGSALPAQARAMVIVSNNGDTILTPKPIQTSMPTPTSVPTTPALTPTPATTRIPTPAPNKGTCGNNYCDEDGLPSLPSGGRYEKICSNCCGTDKRWDFFSIYCGSPPPLKLPLSSDITPTPTVNQPENENVTPEPRIIIWAEGLENSGNTITIPRGESVTISWEIRPVETRPLCQDYDSLLNSFLFEESLETIERRAKEAGLIANRGGSDPEALLVSDPCTDEIIFSAFYIGSALNFIQTANADFLDPGFSQCGSTTTQLFATDGKFEGIKKNNPVIRVLHPSFGRIYDINEANKELKTIIDDLNSELDLVPGLPHFTFDPDSTNPDIDMKITPVEPGFDGRAMYKHYKNHYRKSDKEYSWIGINPLVFTYDPSDFKNIIKHEFGHLMGLAHIKDENTLMHGVIKENQSYTFLKQQLLDLSKVRNNPIGSELLNQNCTIIMPKKPNKKDIQLPPETGGSIDSGSGEEDLYGTNYLSYFNYCMDNPILAGYKDWYFNEYGYSTIDYCGYFSDYYYMGYD